MLKDDPEAMPRPLSTRLAAAWYRLHLLSNHYLHRCSQIFLYDFLLYLSGVFHERYYHRIHADFRAIKPSETTMAALTRLDVHRLIERRRRNVEYLYSELKGEKIQLAYSEDWSGWVPMAVPAYVIGADRVSVQEKAKRAGVLLSTLCDRWDHIPPDERDFYEPELYYLNHHVLIPVNEHIDSTHMKHLVKVLNAL
jgi:hypothetical protein